MKSRWSSVVMLATVRTGCDGEDTARGYRSRSEPLAQPREVGRVLLDPAGRLTDHRRLRVPDHRGKQVRLELSGPEVGGPVDRKSGGEGKRVGVRGVLGGRR